MATLSELQTNPFTVMQRKDIFIGIGVGLIVGGVLWLWHSSMPLAPQIPSPSPSTVAQKTPAGAQVSLPTPKEEAVDYDGRSMTREEATRIYVQRVRQDENYDWKQPLNFYGKVVDQDHQPVLDASVDMVWTTLGVPGGSSETRTSSDGDGLFSLAHQRGKVLEVRVQKDGYYTVDRGGSAVPFDYANPSDPSYIVPDAAKPVVFHLRRKGEGAKLISESVDLSLHGKASGEVDLMSGQIASAGSLQVRSNKPDSQAARRLYPWSVTLDMPSGGLIETNDQFPFMAPANGYSPTAMMDMTNPNVATWRNGDMKSYYFYLPVTKTYGLMRVNSLGANSHVYLNYFYNPTPGDRNLEPASQ